MAGMESFLAAWCYIYI